MDCEHIKRIVLLTMTTFVLPLSLSAQQHRERGVYQPPLLVDGKVITEYERITDETDPDAKDTDAAEASKTESDRVRQVGFEEVYDEGIPFESIGPAPGGHECFDGSCGSACDGQGCGCHPMSACACGCGVSCPPRFGCCLPAHRFFGGLEYLMWWRRGQILPPLVQTSDTDTATPANVAFGDSEIGQEMTNGGRVTLGLWDPACCNSLVVRFWSPGEESNSFAASDATANVVGIPFFNADTNVDDFFLIARQADGITGNVNIHTQSEIYGGDVMLRRRWKRGLGAEADFFWGYQTARINESLTMNIDTTIQASGNRLQVTDSFATKNEYHAASFGFDGRYREGLWSMRLLTKLGFGSMSREANVSGRTTRSNGANNVAVDNQGFFARSTNSGTFDSSKFSFSPEITFTLGYDIRPGVQFTLGYNYLLFTNVIQPWQLLDTTTSDINTNPTSRPAIRLDDDDYWVQGIQWGLFCRY